MIKMEKIFRKGLFKHHWKQFSFFLPALERNTHQHTHYLYMCLLGLFALDRERDWQWDSITCLPFTVIIIRIRIWMWSTWLQKCISLSALQCYWKKQKRYFGFENRVFGQLTLCKRNLSFSIYCSHPPPTLCHSGCTLLAWSSRLLLS